MSVLHPAIENEYQRVPASMYRTVAQEIRRVRRACPDLADRAAAIGNMLWDAAGQTDLTRYWAIYAALRSITVYEGRLDSSREGE